MDGKLKIMTIVISVIYAVIIGGYIYPAINVFVHGFKAGFNKGLEARETGSVVAPSAVGIYFLSLKPESGYHTFPSTFRNQSDRKPMEAEIGKMTVQVSDVTERLPKGWIAYDICSVFLGFFVIFVMVMIPIQAFRILRSITKDKIFDPSNIQKLRFIGYALLAYYSANVVASFLHYRIAANVVEIDGYSLLMDWGNTSLVLLGFVVLMFAEILKVSVQMKEEQDLTV